MSKEHFQFTLGPVQSFVAQARRTRDFWAGSFILSWLAGVAMQAVEAQDGTIIFPVPAQDYLRWIDGSRQGRNGPQQGGIPNRFLADVPSTFQPQQVTESVQKAWQALAATVWQHDLADFPDADRTTQAIWNRQIAGFWEMSWVYGADSNLLDRRKNWRSHAGTVEPGVKCMVMDGWQELSGAAGPLKPDGQRLEQFWQRLRTRMTTDLAENEHLCAIAFVKRRFARHFATVQAAMPNGWTLHGWRVPTGVPSVQYLAAAHWLENVIYQTDDAAIRAFCTAAEQAGGERGEWATRITCIETAVQQQRQDKPDVSWLAGLDGSLFYRTFLENSRLYKNTEAAQQAARALARLSKTAPAPFYAVLLMDGDSLGVHMSDEQKRPAISKALEKFTGGVQAIVERHNGFLVYAGGDDVLALLPLDDALGCAAALRASYLAAFKPYPAIPSTLSGAIEFAHVKMPLTRVLKDAHALLDDVAKDGRGRDAIAVRVWKPGGAALTWAMPWACALENGTGQPLKIQTLAQQLRDDEQAERDPGFSSKFLYKVRERFVLLNPTAKEQGIVNEDQARTLLAVDYLASGGNPRKLKLEQAKAELAVLVEQCRPVIRHLIQPDKIRWEESPRLEEDGALLVRFLVQKGVER